MMEIYHVNLLTVCCLLCVVHHISARTGIKWLTIGDDWSFECWLRNCNSSHIQPYVETVDTSSTRHRLHYDCTTSTTMTVTLENTTQHDSGLFSCRHDNNRKKKLKKNRMIYYKVKVMDKLREPQNTSCMLFRKVLTCTSTVHDRVGYSQYRCHAVERYTGRVNDIEDGECPDLKNVIKHNVTHITRVPRQNSLVCQFTCQGGMKCLENIMVVITGTNRLSNLTYCHLAKLKNIVKPDKVSELSAVNIADSSVGVYWQNKGYEQWSSFIYNITWTTNREKTSYHVTRKSSMNYNITELKPGHRYNISVTSRSSAAGYPSDAAYTQVTVSERGKSDLTNPDYRHISIYIVLSSAVVLMFVLACVITGRNVTCDHYPIQLPLADKATEHQDIIVVEDDWPSNGEHRLAKEDNHHCETSFSASLNDFQDQLSDDAMEHSHTCSERTKQLQKQQFLETDVFEQNFALEVWSDSHSSGISDYRLQFCNSASDYSIVGRTRCHRESDCGEDSFHLENTSDISV